ncbi:unnamed protein product [Brugia pahangi]|uniref:Secreted protein n=1 Tax=Brugia pahangi TaxID=6280 RepID=A0A0N4TMK9_BRUPA|nr:unnamed protein product [Brugia pahangi]
MSLMCLTVHQSLSSGTCYGAAWIREVWHDPLSIQQGSGATPKQMNDESGRSLPTSATLSHATSLWTLKRSNQSTIEL